MARTDLHGVEQPDVCIDVIALGRAIELLPRLLEPLDTLDILAAQVMDDEPVPGRVVVECLHARDGRALPLRVDLARLMAHRARQGRGEADSFAATELTGL